MTLFSISKHMKDSSPVFIVGEARSGTSVLQRTLELHSKFKPHSVTHVEAQIFGYCCRSYKLEMTKWHGPFDYMHRDEVIFSEFIKTIRFIRMLHAILASNRVRAVINKYSVLWAIVLNHILIRVYFYYAGRARQCARIVEGSPNNSTNLKKIKLSFPHSQMIYIYRSPVDVYSSYRKVVRNAGETNWANISPSEFCRLYKVRLSSVVNYAREHDDLYMVKYEDFVRNPEGEFQSLCNFLGIDYESDAVSITHNADRHDSYEKHIRGPIVQKTKNWEDFMTYSEAQYIEDQMSDEMDNFGYARYTRPDSLGLPA
jgi:hypothetical protein